MRGGDEMRIEKINDNQVRFTLTREDLEQRQIKLSELAYGSPKAKALFREMLRWASYKYGFEVEDIPLMVEAIPISSEALVLIVTKFPYPEELDPRFSRFTEGDGTLSEGEDYYDEEEELLSDDELEDLFGGMQPPSLPKLGFEGSADDIVKIYGNPPASENEAPAEGDKKKAPAPKTDGADIPNLTRIYRFTDFDALIRVSCIAQSLCKGFNSLTKDYDQNYYLTIRRDDTDLKDFNRLTNILAEYGIPQKDIPGLEAYYSEQYTTVLSDHAMEALAQLA